MTIEYRRTKGGSIAQVTVYPELYQPRGGHMPFPPADCTQLSRSFLDEESGMRWLLNYWCDKKYCPRSPCPRRKAFKAGNTAEWYDEAHRLANVRRKLRGEPPRPTRSKEENQLTEDSAVE